MTPPKPLLTASTESKTRTHPEVARVPGEVCLARGRRLLLGHGLNLPDERHAAVVQPLFFGLKFGYIYMGWRVVVWTRSGGDVKKHVDVKGETRHKMR